MHRGPATIVLNGQLRTYQYLAQILHISEIAQVDVYTEHGITMLWGVFPPVIVLTTWPPETWGADEKKKNYFKYLLPLGYQHPVEFYSPQYDTPEARNNLTEDLRTTIYWKPNVLLDDKNSATVEFYTADTPTACSIVIEGIGSSGNLIYHREKAVIKVEL
ncbi:MAG: hypothetical protein LBP72_02110 [Dysgonamonadaceae bacterium]|jgi:hypothetical protein|nr:hypothetical protein [Dysgonamonadaceae bacterium]